MACKFTEGTFTLVRAGRNVQSVEGKAFSLLGLKGQERKELVRGARKSLKEGATQEQIRPSAGVWPEPCSVQWEGAGE